MTATRRLLLAIYEKLYRLFCLLVVFQMSADKGHHRARSLLSALERLRFLASLFKVLRRLIVTENATEVGGLRLSQSLILGAGLLKGQGFVDEDGALRAVESGDTIIRGLEIVPALVGPIEIGSFTRYPRLGNDGTWLARRVETRSTQNRMGLPNPGARAAALFLASRRERLPDEYGINIAPSPGVNDLEARALEVCEALDSFLAAQLNPAWFTLNLSCPNTEDDPLGMQLETEARRICGAFLAVLRQYKADTPLWVKLSPGLDASRCETLLRIFDEIGVAAVIATNTMPAPMSSDPSLQGGVGGGDLHAAALETVRNLQAAKARLDCDVDIIACGGILDGASWRAFREAGAVAGQYWSALVYRGPFAAALIANELEAHERSYEAVHRERLA